MGKPAHVSETPATKLLKREGVVFSEHVYAYEEHGGTAVSARALGVAEHDVVKTLVMEDERQAPLIVLMHGDRSVSTKNLARQAGRKTIAACAPLVAERHSGYQIGGTSPFGTRKRLSVFLEKSILARPKIYINGGRRGYLVGIDPAEIVRLLAPIIVEVGLPSTEHRALATWALSIVALAAAATQPCPHRSILIHHGRHPHDVAADPAPGGPVILHRAIAGRARHRRHVGLARSSGTARRGLIAGWRDRSGPTARHGSPMAG